MICGGTAQGSLTLSLDSWIVLLVYLPFYSCYVIHYVKSGSVAHTCESDLVK